MADASKANPQSVEKLGYLGLGLMGTPMARRLLNAGYPVSVWNRSEGKVAPLVEAGAKRTGTPRDLLANSDIVFMCVTDAAAVEEVIFGPFDPAYWAPIGPRVAIVDGGRDCPDRADPRDGCRGCDHLSGIDLATVWDAARELLDSPA